MFSTLRSAVLPGVEIASSSYAGQIPPFHFLPAVQVTHIVEGVTRLRVGSQEIVVEPGDMMLNGPDCNPRVLERLSASGTTVRVLIRPKTFNLLAGPVADQFDAGIFRLPALAGALGVLLASMSADEPPALQTAALAALVGQTTAALQTTEGMRLRARKLRPEVVRVRQILRDRWAEPVSLAELTDAVGLSGFHLLRLFREQVGTPPHHYQLHLRISRAREMLDRGLPIADVALDCGFADQPHFTRWFKRVVGFTPAAFARLG